MSTVVVATMFIREGKEREAEDALRALAEATHVEAGCLSYALHRDLQEPRRLVFVERWTSSVALENHLQQPHVKAVDPGLFERPADIRVLEPMPAGDPMKGSL